MHKGPPEGSPFVCSVTDLFGNGGRTRTRTLDPLIKSQLLYQLSYAPIPMQAFKPAGEDVMVGAQGLEPWTR